MFDDIPSWPTPAPAANPRAMIGGNTPPLGELIPAEFRSALLAERPDFLDRMADLIGAADRAYADDDESLAKCADLVKALRAAQTHIDVTHKSVKQYWLDGGRLVDAEKNTLLASLNQARAQVDHLSTVYVARRDAEQRAERARIEAEQRAAAAAAARAEHELRKAQDAAAAAANARTAARAEEARLAAEQAMAAAALAPAPVQNKGPLRSDSGATVSARQEWECAVEDYARAFAHVKNDPKVMEAIDTAIRRLVKQTKGQIALDGVRSWPVAKAVFR